MSDDLKKDTNNYLKYSGLGLQMLLTIGVLGWLGYKTDQYLQLSFPAFMIGLGFVGFIGIMIQLYRTINKN
jgi:hypothetical protein